MAVFLGVLVAAAFGSGDFLGGRASKRSSLVCVLLISQGTAVAAAVVLTSVVAGHVSVHDVAFGAAAGAANVTGLAFLYRALGTGRMAVVAPVAAVVGAVVPVGWGLAVGEHPGPVVVVGIICAVLAGGLIARERNGRSGAPTTESVLLALAAGAGLGTSLIFFAVTSSRSGLSPVLTARLTATAMVSLALLVVRHRQPFVLPVGRQMLSVVGAGILDVTAMTLLLLAVRRGLTVVVAPLASLGPAFTVLWARVALDEDLTREQAAGMTLALIGLVLIAVG